MELVDALIEEGLVLLVQSGLTVVTAPGGFFAQLPKDQISAANPRAWTYRFITSEPNYNLNGQDGFTAATVQIDCHGYAAADAIALARAIDKVLRGAFKGALADPDATYVDSIFRREPFVDGFSDVNRSYVRSLEYLINYNQI